MIFFKVGRIQNIHSEEGALNEIDLKLEIKKVLDLY